MGVRSVVGGVPADDTLLPTIGEARVRAGEARDDDIFQEITAELAAQPEPGADLALEDWIAFGLFWVLAGTVFLQFFTRYVLNDSLAWTEEIARYQLMALAFLGAPMAARRGTHIAVSFLLGIVPPSGRAALRLAAGVLSVAFLATATFLCWQVSVIMETQFMVVVDWPLSIVFYACTAGLALTTLRAVQHLVVLARSGGLSAAPDIASEKHV
jgi:TRAP-type C4-dicarboxylate transport system permease small subunit